jgi:hypothetical protein
MPRFDRKQVILLKPEVTYGVDSVPTGAANALLVGNPNINPMDAKDVPREILSAFFGGDEILPGTRVVDMTFDLELQGSGAAGTVPPCGAALRAVGFAETNTPGQRTEYNPITDALESCTIYWHDDGVKHAAVGCRGAWELPAQIGDIPKLRLHMMGLYSTPSVAANPSPTLTAFKTPLPVTDANSGDITLGCTYATGAISGGQAYPSQGISLNGGNQLAHTPMLGGESVDITNRDITGMVTFDLTPTQYVTLMGSVETAAKQSLGWVHGTAAGLKVLLFAPAVQLRNPRKVNLNGRRLDGFDLKLTRSAGNDDLRIVFP